MDVQLINYSGKNEKGYSVKEVKTFGTAMSLDMFDLNVIDLMSKDIWTDSSGDSDFNGLDLDNDFKSLKAMIDSIGKSQLLFILPSNCMYFTSYSNYYEKYRKNALLKDCLTQFNSNLKKVLPNFQNTLFFEPTLTKIANNAIRADFYISEIDDDIECLNLIKSNKSEKLVSVSWDRFTMTTLQLENQEQLENYLKKVNLLPEEKSSIPDWMADIKFFDDIEKDRLIEERQQTIKELENDIHLAEEKLAENAKYKSILYTSGDELVDVVKEMLEKMLEINLSEFVDKKKEDIAFSVDGEYFIGEIKGVTSTVTTQNLSQLDNHLTSFTEEYQLDEDNVRRLLIMNTQRNRPLSDRDPVDPAQINKATNKYGSLIVLTETLLKLFEQYQNGKLTRSECLDKFRQTGLLDLNPL